MGPCAEFSVYHLMELEAGEEHLNSEASDFQNQLIRSSVNIFGKGQSLVSNDDFKASVALLQEKYESPAVTPGFQAKSKSNSGGGAASPAVTLSDICKVLRSKNAGPFEITLDAIFVSRAAYQSVKASNLLSRESVAKALGVWEEDIVWMGFSEPALAFKVTIPRFRGGKKRSAGSFMENDVHGSQQHMGLARMKLEGASSTRGWRADERLVSLGKPLWATQNWYKMATVLGALWGMSALAGLRYLFFRQKSG